MKKIFLMAVVITVTTGLSLSLAADVAPSPGYGTGVYFDQGSLLAPVDFTVVKDGVPSSVSKSGTSVASAAAAPDRFEMGIFLEDKTVGRMAGAQAASKYAVSGLPEGTVVPGLMFTINGRAASTASGAYSVYFIAFDYRGNFLADAAIVGELIIDPDTGVYFKKETFAGNFCPDPVVYPGSCNDPSDPLKNRTVYISGEGARLTLPVFLPVLQDEGIIAELWLSTDSAVRLDFMNAAVLAGSPPKGVTVRLATGQTFDEKPRVP